QGVHQRSAEDKQRRPEKMAAVQAHFELAMRGNLCGTIPAPSLTAMILSIGTLVSLSTNPLGQFTSRESIFVLAPNPKCIRGSLADIYPIPPFACSNSTTPCELSFSDEPIPSRFDLVPTSKTVSQ